MVKRFLGVVKRLLQDHGLLLPGMVHQRSPEALDPSKGRHLTLMTSPPVLPPRPCPKQLWPIARRKLDQLNRVAALRELSVPPGNRLERLRQDRVGQHSIRINEQFRVCFRWNKEYADEVEITDYH